MSLNEQIGIYAGVILAMLTILRVISGITGSRSVKSSVLMSAVSSFFALGGVVFARILLEIKPINSFVVSLGDTPHIISMIWLGLWALSIFYFFGLGVLVRLYVRSSRFKDWGPIGNLRVFPLAKWYRDWHRNKKGDKKGYETNSPESAANEHTINIFKQYFGENINYRRPIFVTGDSPWQLRERLIELIVYLLENTKEEFNYVCCTVSPANIWNLIEKKYPEVARASELKQRLVFVDAYTNTFGFGDEILTDRINKMRAEKHIEVVSCSSAAGVHNGTTNAFKILKKHAENNKREREACTVIYDSLSSLSIPETEEEVSEFIIHLAAAEHTYDMQTVFVEFDVENRKALSLETIRSCCGSPINVKEINNEVI